MNLKIDYLEKFELFNLPSFQIVLKDLCSFLKFLTTLISQFNN